MKLSDLNGIDFPTDFADELEQRLTPLGRLHTLGMGLRIADRKNAVELCLSFLTTSLAGSPLPALLDFKDQARWWVQLASRDEKKAHLLAIFEHLSKSDRDAFLKYYNDNPDKFEKPPSPKKENSRVVQELEEILAFWDTYLKRMDTDSWEYGFACQINKRRKWNNWHPTEKQKFRILQIGREYSAVEEDVEVVE